MYPQPYQQYQQDTSFLVCEHKHMNNSGATPDKVWQCICLFCGLSTMYPQPYQQYQQDTSFLVCEHKHMNNSGATPDKVRVLHCLLPIEYHGFTSRIDF